jgi:hypothetical protein
VDYTVILLIAAALAGAWNVFVKAGRQEWEADNAQQISLKP